MKNKKLTFRTDNIFAGILYKHNELWISNKRDIQFFPNNWIKIDDIKQTMINIHDKYKTK